MNLSLWLLYFLPVSGALKVLPEVQLDVEWGGSVIIECPLPQTRVRMYLCRQMTNPEICTTVVSNNFVKKEYERRVTLKPCLDKKLFLVEMTQLTENDNGIYACGVGMNTDLGKTQKVTLNVHNEYPEPFWEDVPTSEPPRRLFRFLQHQIPWLHMGEHASSSGIISKVTTPTPKTEVPLVHQPSSIASVTRHPRVYRAFSVTATKSPAPLPATTASKTSTQQAIRPLEASYSHHTRLHGQGTLHHGPQYGREDRGLHIPIPEFHILIPTFLGFLLLVLLGLVVKRAVQRRRAFSRRAGRRAMRMRGRGASRPNPSQRRDAPQRPRSQNNIYSACPRRARGPDSVGPADAPLLHAAATASPALPQVLETCWPQTPPLKMSCDYTSLCHQPAVNVEDPDSDDYINILGPPHLPSYLPGPRPSCQ
ncbi:fas apoptotic inhibitory molecule 3 [Grammomys surdaster]|uniref:fas apoptotic inhibitory molecule 3 n=1 Tax=Grammomys surdaster TaxID=491861 RepID=UPI00109F7D25|nr:fas apoptotic inhibitory molecule 3 [Grammomys surdaster]